LKSKKCIVTGAEGFLGSHMVDFLVGKGFAVYATVYKDTDNLDHLKDKIPILWCDIRDRERIESKFSRLSRTACSTMPPRVW